MKENRINREESTGKNIRNTGKKVEQKIVKNIEKK